MTRRVKGFTLIELLAVIAIIGILAALAAISISNATKRARDAQRKRDLSNVKTALELYSQDNGRYPAGDFATMAGSLKTGTYIKTEPKDPDSGLSYMYLVDTTGDNFALQATLEYKKDKATLTGIVCGADASDASKGNGVATNTGQSDGSDRCFRLTND